ncbi:OmpA family protein [bacterium SCSIO 12741]|nr:OmpA family protein [bacterium SCSIO 12741]
MKFETYTSTLVSSTLVLFLGLLYSCSAQETGGYPKHYKTVESQSFAAGDTLVIEYLFELDGLKIGPSEWASSLYSFLSKHPEFDYVIVCHTDARGSEEANAELSTKRAERIKNEMVELGFPADRLRALGKGESDPVIKEETIAQLKTKEEKEKAHQLNRRTELILIKP